MLLGIGIDILSLSRFEGVIARRGFQVVAKRICCARELDEFGGLRDDPGLRVRYLSSRWAIKEAAYKSLYPYMKTTFRSFDLRRSKAGQPKLHLLGQTISDKNKDKQASGLGDFEAGEVDLLASLSHDAGVVVGVVIAQRQRK